LSRGHVVKRDKCNVQGGATGPARGDKGEKSRWPLILHYLTLPPAWASSYTCPALRPYQFSPMHVPECNHKVTGNGYKAVDGCEAVGCKAVGCKAVKRRL